mmetsp:Transcript_2852/g.6063  ORF Transcript_2852/g.6063 Transcript_2852/m.6063 type:complete len:283 (+) Transcript_2852:1123-1971(+)
MQQHIALHAHGMIVFGFEHVLFHQAGLFCNGLFLCWCCWHVCFSEFSRSSKDLRQRFRQRVFTQRVVEPSVSIIHDILLTKLGRVRIVSPHGIRNDTNHNEQVPHQDKIAIVRVQKKGGQPNGNLHVLLSVGISKLLVVFAGSFIRQGFVRFADHDKFCFCSTIARVFIRMVNETQTAVGFLDCFVVRAMVNLQNREGIERVDFSILADGNDQKNKQGSQCECDDQVRHKSVRLQSLPSFGFLFELLGLFLFRRGTGDGANCCILGRKCTVNRAQNVIPRWN